MLDLFIAAATASVLQLPPVRVLTRNASQTPAAVSVLREQSPPTMHPGDLLEAAPGAWVTVNSGQESLVAIRSPVLTGSGACGSFSMLENGVPIRPAGFCNVNQLFEMDLASADAVEVLRGPAPVVLGSNGVHGAIAGYLVAGGEGADTAVTLGSSGHLELGARVASDALELRARARNTDGWRDSSGYEQYFLHVLAQGARGSALMSFSELHQETAGFILGEGAYRDIELARRNPNPEAYRDARALRLGAELPLGGAWTLRPFARDSRMGFIQHFLPGQPIERNAHTSAGLIGDYASGDWLAGVHLETGSAELKQFQDGPTQGSEFLRLTRPPGAHYDYTVDMNTAAAYAQWQRSVADWTWSVGARVEYTHYGYDNRLLDGNTRDDGQPCALDGCLYTRPADRSDDFLDLAPQGSLVWRLAPNQSLRLRAARGFRVPQVTELYRLQSGQTVAELDSERIDSLELAYRHVATTAWLDLVLYYAHKRDSVFRDRDGFNVSGAGTRHRGLELESRWSITEDLQLGLAASYALHTYGSVAGSRQAITPGLAVDTAPRLLAHASLARSFGQTTATLAWRRVGRHYLDAANEHSYPGHSRWDLSLQRRLGAGLSATLELRNLTDRRYAERADFAFGSYRYLPGRPRTLFITVSWES